MQKPPIERIALPSPDNYPLVDSHRPHPEAKLSSSTVPSLQRTKKRVLWRGKACIISLPPPHSEAEFKNSNYLTENDVDRRLREWQIQGYDVSGFQLNHQSNDSLDSLDRQPQTRPSFPDPAEVFAERGRLFYRTKIPDRVQWDSYVDGLREAKLLALGVTLPSNPYRTQESPVVLPLDRNPSSHGFRLPISSPLVPPPSADLLPAQVFGTQTPTQDTLGPKSQQETVASSQYQIPHSHFQGVSELLDHRLNEAEDIPPMIRGRLKEDQSFAQPNNTTLLTAANEPQDTCNCLEYQNRSVPVNSNFNALAPEFKSGIDEASSLSVAGTIMRPTAPTFVPIAASQVGGLTREFSFSSAGPSFKPGNIMSGFEPTRGELAPTESNGLFSTVTYPVISQPVKKSKAIPILRPKHDRRMIYLENEVQEDESGRITQADGRQKRVRQSSQSGDSKVRYTTSNQAPRSTSEHYPGTDTHSSSAMLYRGHIRQDIFSLTKATQAADQLREIIDDLSASEDLGPQAQSTEDIGFDRPGSTVDGLQGKAASDGLRPYSSSSGRRADVRFAVTSDIGSLNEQSTACGSIQKRVLDSPTHGPIKAAVASPDTKPLADSDTLKSLQREPSLRPSPSSVTSAPHVIAGLHQMQQAISIASHADGSNVQDSAGAIPEGVSYIEPSYEEIDAVLKHLDDEGSSVGMKENNRPSQAQDAGTVSVLDFYKSSLHPEEIGLHQLGNDAQRTRANWFPPSTHQYLQQAESESADSSIVRAIAENARFSPSYRPSRGPDGDLRSVSSTDSAESDAINEWDDAFSSNDEARIHERQSFLDARAHEVVGNALQVRLAPLERSLAEIQRSLTDLPKQSAGPSPRVRPADNADTSDADDEDGTGSKNSTTRSYFGHHKIDRLKTLAAHLALAQQNCIPTNELASLTNDIKGLKVMLQEKRPSFADVKTVVEEAIGKQMRGRSGPVTSSHQSATAEKNQLQITGLESMLKIAEGRAEDELKARRATEDALADSQRLLRLALQDAAEQRESAEETERSLSTFHEERHDVLRRNAILEGTQESLQKSASELAEKSVALEGTLEEYRLSSAQWREEIESAKVENSDLRRTMGALKVELEEGIRGRQALRTRFDQLQDEMITASQNIAQDQSLWRRKEEKYIARCEVLISNHERESQRCERMEREMAVLSKNLRFDREKNQQATTKYESELNEQREAARLEQVRPQNMKENDGKAIMRRFNDLQTALNVITATSDSLLEQANTAARIDAARHEQLQHEAAAYQAAALQEHQIFHDQVVKNLTEQHQQLSKSMVRERQSVENQYGERIALADEKLLHYQDRIQHLEESLEIAKSAAHAAVQAAQSKQPTTVNPQQRHSSGSDAFPEKISPQALRESILVLQEQLQDRENRIEQLEQKLFAVDMDAPARLKAQETENTWLRELFAVRIDELQDLIIALAQPVYDRDAIKDAAIRLKANLEMEQQEKARAEAGGQSLPPSSSIASLTSSPRSIPLAAAAAWGSWLRGRDAASSSGFNVAHRHTINTPSRASPSTQSMLSGLLTPPRSSIRRSAGPRVDLNETSSMLLDESSASSMHGSSLSHARDHKPYETSPRMTPSLTRTINYDLDARSADLESISGVGTDGRGRDAAEEEDLFGPPIAAFPGRGS
ncbi:MAG: hypothetical protein Q9170_002276 [Blastenia crenularia]